MLNPALLPSAWGEKLQRSIGWFEKWLWSTVPSTPLHLGCTYCQMPPASSALVIQNIHQSYRYSGLCGASILCLKKARRCIVWNCSFFVILWFFHWEGEEGCPPVFLLQLLTVLSTPAPWLGHSTKASAAAWAAKGKPLTCCYLPYCWVEPFSPLSLF